MLSTDRHCDNLSIKQILANDIRKYAEEMNVSIQQVMKDISKNKLTGIRTLQRFFQPETEFVPHVRTLVNIYSQMYDTESLADIISKAPEQIGSYIRNNHTNYTVAENLSGGSKNLPLQLELTSSSVFNQIYLMTGGEYGTELSVIRKMFGEFGLKELDKLILAGFVEIDADDKITRKEKISWELPIRKRFAKTVINDIYNIENADSCNKNYISVITGEVSPEVYKLIRTKMKKHNDEILTMVNESNPSYEDAVKFVSTEVMEEIQFKNKGDLLC